MTRYRCPKCHESDTLYETVMVPGWRSVDEELNPIGGHADRDLDWYGAESDYLYGCGNCEWEGTKSGLEVLGIDNEPLVPVHPDQMELS